MSQPRRCVHRTSEFAAWHAREVKSWFGPGTRLVSKNILPIGVIPVLKYGRPPQLKATLAALEADLEDLEESVKVVESTGPRLFNLDDAEVAERRRYVGRVKREITVRLGHVGMFSFVGREPVGTRRTTGMCTLSNHKQTLTTLTIPQLMIAEQDRTMDSISGTLTTLAQQAGLMGQEIGQHNEMLDDIEQDVDHTDSKLDSAMRKMKKFIQDTEDTKSGWCITILVIVLAILLVAVILV
ncbi:hypothetical protein J3R83DRAFT_9699 [Lanmaoa asiatica]|nr:hypothetical protein J3R83DRAFT_9699 [Lanmaoa asiatica]